MKYNLIAPCYFGTESAAAFDFKRIGAENIAVTDGRVAFTGDADIIAAANLQSRCAERVLMLLKTYKATTFDELFSEVSNEYIQELSDVLTEGQQVKVKVLSVSPEGKIALSIKKCEPRPARPQRADVGRTWQPRSAAQPQGELSFEDMMSQFKTRSEEKISDLKRVTEARRGGGYSRRGH